MSDKYIVSNAELEAALNEQLSLLERAADAFDDGIEVEAKNIALRIRVLVYDTKSSKSLLGQLDRKNTKYLDTAFEFSPTNVVPHSGLVPIAMNSSGPRYRAMLDASPVKNEIGFNEWWNSAVFKDKQGRFLSRKQLIVTAANQDGGAHVDGSLDPTYAALKKENALGWMIKDGKGNRPMEGPERAAIRQIAHEVLKTLKPGYAKWPKKEADVVFGGISITENEPPNNQKTQSSSKGRKIGRNELCPCGSGMKYKKCHGE